MELNVIIKVVLSVMLIPIFLLHLYWLCGGECYLDEALPTDITKVKEKYSKTKIKILNILSITPVLAVLAILFLSLYPIYPVIYKYHAVIYQWAAILCVLRAIFGWTLMSIFTHKTVFLEKNKTLYSPIFLCLGLLFLALYLV